MCRFACTIARPDQCLTHVPLQAGFESGCSMNMDCFCMGQRPRVARGACLFVRVFPEFPSRVRGQCVYCKQSNVQDFLGSCQSFQDAKTEETFWAHWKCMIWTTETLEDDNGRIKNLADSVKRGKRMKCGMITIPKGGKKKLNRSLRESPEICPHRGGTIGCEGRYCRFTFHYACAKAKGCYMHESKHPKTNAVQYKLYCPNHIPSNVSTPCAAPSAQPPLSATPDHPPANEQAPPVLPAAQCAQPDQPCQSAETTRCNTGEEAEDHGVDEMSNSDDTDKTTLICSKPDSKMSSREVEENDEATSMPELQMRDMEMDLDVAEFGEGERISKKMKCGVGAASSEITPVHASDNEDS